jgi:hypothetical protein
MNGPIICGGDEPALKEAFTRQIRELNSSNEVIVVQLPGKVEYMPINFVIDPTDSALTSGLLQDPPVGSLWNALGGSWLRVGVPKGSAAYNLLLKAGWRYEAGQGAWYHAGEATPPIPYTKRDQEKK